VPVVPVAFALFSFAIALNEIRTNPLNATIGLLLVLVGIPVYWIWLRRATTKGNAL
jgi:heme O synthase-like polyprenyltransferase